MGLVAALLLIPLGLYGCSQSLTGPGDETDASTDVEVRPYASVQVAPARYIVLLKSGASPADVARAHGVTPDFVYTAALSGFAGPASAAQVRALEGDPRVKSIEPDRVASLVPPLDKGKPGGGTAQPPQTIPAGINRIDADLSSTMAGDGSGSVDADVAIIDTGIQSSHPDLYVVGGKNCASGRSWNDGNGHGTHVAGIAAAIDNSIGVVGVAPGARLWAVRVLDNSGSGFLSWVICGVDWVTANASTIEAANMSLGFEGTSSALDEAIARSVAAGVTYAVAAGNSSKDASSFSPANHPDVITVSAIADSDGRCGGFGPATSYGADDAFASFSNFGSSVELAAPGVDILSTYKGGGYAALSGTSMASPHVAGAAALYKANNPGATPAGVHDALIAAGVPQHNACASDGNGGFTGDPDHDSHPSSLDEPLVYAAGS
jgi:subtilisin family serine protease